MLFNYAIVLQLEILTILCAEWPDFFFSIMTMSAFLVLYFLYNCWWRRFFLFFCWYNNEKCYSWNCNSTFFRISEDCSCSIRTMLSNAANPVKHEIQVNIYDKKLSCFFGNPVMKAINEEKSFLNVQFPRPIKLRNAILPGLLFFHFKNVLFF